MRLAVAAVVVVSGVALDASAQELQWRASAGATHALTAPQRTEFGWGLTGGAQAELKFTRAFSVHAGLEGLLLAEGQAPPRGFASNGTGNAALAALGVRAYPAASFGRHLENVWVAMQVGYVRTGSADRTGFGADVGYDVWFRRFAVGPFLGYRHVVQPDSQLRPEDARLLSFGIQGVWSPKRPQAVGDRDWDRDGIPNEKDACPREPEDIDGFQDADGCPDLDNDRDGIVDRVDLCPDEPEDRDGYEDEDGCPELDNDKDGILDKRDACPNDPEDFDGFEDADGCPDLDNDKDEIPDVTDKCPDEPETFNGYADEDGCPDEISVRVVGAHIYLDERIYFEWNRAEIRKQSFPLVQRIASLLINHPEYVQVSIEGHTDEMGSADYNQHLSEARANAVRDKLIQNGVAPDRLVATGYGESRPLIKGTSEKATSINRRVEFLITRRRTTLPASQDSSTPAAAPARPDTDPNPAAASGSPKGKQP